MPRNNVYVCYFIIRTTKCSTTSDLQIVLPNSLIKLMSCSVSMTGILDFRAHLLCKCLYFCVYMHIHVCLAWTIYTHREPLSLGSRQDPLHRAGSGICVYPICQGQSRSLKQSQEKYPDLLTLLLPQGCCFIFFFLVASRICSLQCVCKKMVIEL